MSHHNKRHSKHQQSTLVINRGTTARVPEVAGETAPPPPQPVPQFGSARAGELASDHEQDLQSVSDDEVRVLAYAKWQEAGCPPGDGVAFWFDAEQTLR